MEIVLSVENGNTQDKGGQIDHGLFLLFMVKVVDGPDSLTKVHIVD